jgi:hypothetical protein
MKESRRTVAPSALEREACLDLLDAAQLARVLISVKCLPVALPARISLVDRHHLLLASTEPAVRHAAESREVLSAQIDGLDEHAMVWSVMVSGIGSLVEPDESLSAALAEAVARGASVILLPLSVMVGQHG